MSVNQTSYIIYGIVFPYPEDKDTDWQDRVYDDYGSSFYDKPSQPMNRKNDCVVILDSMSGNYMVVGHVLDRTYGYDGTFSNTPVIIPEGAAGCSSDELVKYIKLHSDLDNTLVDLELKSDAKAQWMVLQHYT